MPYAWRQCEHFEGSVAVNNRPTAYAQNVPPRRSMRGLRPRRAACHLFTQVKWFRIGQRVLSLQIKKKNVFPPLANKLKIPLGPLWAIATVPGSGLFCGRRWRRSGWTSDSEDWHWGHVRHGDRIHSLDHHLHVLPHGACLAQPFNDLQQGEAVSWRDTWSGKAAQSSWGRRLKETLKEKNSAAHQARNGQNPKSWSKRLISTPWSQHYLWFSLETI